MKEHFNSYVSVKDEEVYGIPFSPEYEDTCLWDLENPAIWLYPLSIGHKLMDPKEYGHGEQITITL